jgi:hypothetical protein
MGDLQTALVHNRITIQNQIEIQGPRGHVIGPGSAPLFLNFLQPIQQVARRELCIADDDGIQIRTMFLTNAEGLSF